MRSLPELRHTSKEAWRSFQTSRLARDYKAGNILFYQGNRSLGLHFICRGRVKLVKEDRFGRGQIVRVVKAPDLLGDRAFFAERPYACTGEAMEDSRVCFLEERRYRELFGGDAALALALAKRFARELGRAEESMHCLAACAVNARVASYLLACRRRSAPDSGSALTLTESRTELAQILGTTIEAVSRALARFASKGLVAVDGRRVRILDEQRLGRSACPHAPASEAA